MQSGLKGSVMVPVSIGELLDKISILEIKAQKIIQPERLRNVRHELTLLISARDTALGNSAEELASLASELKQINEQIWEAEDVIHGPEAATLTAQEFARNAHIAFEQNDRRARIKRRINDVAGSVVVEEKSYADFGSTL